MSNKELQAKYDEMHKQGTTAWFSDGREERELILKMGEPWGDVHVIEIGCGEGDLSVMMMDKGAEVYATDYSAAAIRKAQAKHHKVFHLQDYRDDYYGANFDRIVMQGVLEHLDDPFGELQWMIEHFKPKTVITSSPCFLNPRGIVWMTLDMLGAVMSKTDLHYLNLWQFEKFCEDNGYKLESEDCDISWGNDEGMILDLIQRIPLALGDGKLQGKPLTPFLMWLEKAAPYLRSFGATMVYRIDI